jgi:hypothetical protein
LTRRDPPGSCHFAGYRTSDDPLCSSYPPRTVRQAEFDVLYNRGISIEGDLLGLGVECGIVEKSGAWLSIESARIGQGRENARKLLLEN